MQKYVAALYMVRNRLETQKIIGHVYGIQKATLLGNAKNKNQIREIIRYLDLRQ